jgi:hypothetical protein
LLYKRIEDGRLQWPLNQDEVRKLHTKQLVRLLSGWTIAPTVHPVAFLKFCIDVSLYRQIDELVLDGAIL